MLKGIPSKSLRELELQATTRFPNLAPCHVETWNAVPEQKKGEHHVRVFQDVQAPREMMPVREDPDAEITEMPFQLTKLEE